MKLLFVDCCISQRGEESRTRALADAFLKSYRSTHPDTEVETVTPETLLALSSFNADMLNDRDALAGIGAFDAPVFDLARQFRSADQIVVAAPFWDLSYPAALRTYIEYISVNGLCYYYDETGCHGTCKADRLVYLTSGGDFEREDSVGVAHWRQLCVMFGIPAFDYVFSGGLDVDPAKTQELLDSACELARRLGQED